MRPRRLRRGRISTDDIWSNTIQLQEWLEREGYTYPAMLTEGALPNFFTINGKSYPSTDTIRMQVGERVLLRFIGSNNNFIHPMHVHGGPFVIVATDGNVVPQSARIEKHTVNVGPGERFDVIWTAREPGRWLLHLQRKARNGVPRAGNRMSRARPSRSHHGRFSTILGVLLLFDAGTVLPAIFGG
jgi:hypothetical protein